MDADQISGLSNYSIISLLVLILREVAHRLGVPVAPAAEVQQAVQDVEVGQQPIQNQATCFHVCGVTGCDLWCQLDIPHTRHRCQYHSCD